MMPDSHLRAVLREGTFAVTAEAVPPASADPRPLTEQARALRGYADAVNVTDNPTAAAHMSPVAGAAVVAAEGLEPTVQITTRDRNRLGIAADLLGAWAVGARNLLCLTGDPVAVGDHPEAKEVFDLDVLELIRLAVRLRERGELASGRVVEDPPRFLVGVADNPLVAGYRPDRLEAKADAGADFVQTQIVYDVDALRAWADAIRPRGLFERMAVLIGVAPLRGPASARYVQEHLPGVMVPDEVVSRLEAAGADAVDEGVRLTVEVVKRLREVDGIAGVHVMGLGKEEPVRRVIEDAGLLPRPTPAA
jgi:5,10-methylenetetrahydrofolate reductase